MTQENFDTLKEEYIDHIKEFMIKTGGLFPHFSLFADHLEDNDSKPPALIHIPIPEEYMKNSDTKEELVDNVLPEIIAKVKEEFSPVAIAWASEAWMRKGDKDTDIENWQDLPKKEVIIITIESHNKNFVILYNIERKGVQVDKDGDLIDIIELTLEEEDQPQKVAGIFTGLIKKFK